METLEYDLSLDDHLDWSVHAVKQSSVFRRSRHIWQFVAPALFLVGYLIPSSRSLVRQLSLLEGAEWLLAPLVLLYLLPVVAAVFWAIWYPRGAEKKVRKTMERWFKESPARMQFGRTSLTVTAEGITESSELERHQAEWKAVEKIEQTDSHIYIWLPGGKAFIVPRRAFGDDATHRRFMEDVERFRSSETR